MSAGEYGHLVTGRDVVPEQLEVVAKYADADKPKRSGLDWDKHKAPKTAAKAPQLIALPLELIDANPRNVRDDVGDISDLVASIEQNGLVQPLVVYATGPRYQLIAGHRRLAACKEAALEQAPCVVRPMPSAAESVRLMLVENMQRRNLDPIEEALAIKRLMDTAKCNQTVAARLIGKSQAAISQRLMLLELTPAEQAKVRSGEMQVQEAKTIGRTRKGTIDVTKFTGWHFGKTHRLAEIVKRTCKANDHGTNRKVGGVGCGECWEQVIRQHERQLIVEAQT